jgi:hypothetical protein
MPAHGDDAACTGAGVRKPSMKEEVSPDVKCDPATRATDSR